MSKKVTGNSKKTKKVKFTTIIIIVILIIAICIIFRGKEGETRINTESTIKEIVKTEELNTVEYIYNAIATKKKKNGDVKYYVAYEGTVKAGIDFNNIKIETNEKIEKITITIPKVSITETKIKEDKLEFIFTKNKYDTEEVLEEAIELCKKDLKQRANDEDLLYETAEDNTMAAIKGLFKPWVESLNGEYEVEYAFGGDSSENN